MAIEERELVIVGLELSGEEKERLHEMLNGLDARGRGELILLALSTHKAQTAK